MEDEPWQTGVVERVFVFSNFWASIYEYAKYGIDEFDVGPKELFRKYEADLALKHAYDAYNLARKLYYIFGAVQLKGSHWTLHLQEPDFNPYKLT
jgi:hypothetical protein